MSSATNSWPAGVFTVKRVSSEGPCNSKSKRELEQSHKWKVGSTKPLLRRVASGLHLFKDQLCFIWKGHHCEGFLGSVSCKCTVDFTEKQMTKGLGTRPSRSGVLKGPKGPECFQLPRGCRHPGFRPGFT